MSKYNDGSSIRILIVDDDDDICTMLSHLMLKQGYTPYIAHDGAEALDLLSKDTPDLLISDMKMPGIGGQELLHKLKELAIDLPVLVITGHADVGDAVDAMKAGAIDYISKPFNNDHVCSLVDRTLKKSGCCQVEIHSHRCSIAKDGISDFLHQKMGPSGVVGRLARDVARVAHSDISVLIHGETGSGKEVVARAIHEGNRRCNGTFMPIDCGAIQDSLVESEFFGYEKGAFTGAHQRKIGLFEAASGGTLFLDEVANLPLIAQAKLLRVLQEQVIYRVGGHQPIRLDVRVLAASHTDLVAKVAEGTFREDLYYRLNGFTLALPPLRLRKGDIIYLAEHFLSAANSDFEKAISGFSESAIEVMRNYSWPGNVRELQNCIRQAAIFAEEELTEGHLHLREKVASSLCSHPVPDDVPELDQSSLKEIVHRNVVLVESRVILKVLQQTSGNMAKAARILKIDYKTMHTKVKQYGLRF